MAKQTLPDAAWGVCALVDRLAGVLAPRDGLPPGPAAGVAAAAVRSAALHAAVSRPAGGGLRLPPVGGGPGSVTSVAAALCNVAMVNNVANASVPATELAACLEKVRAPGQPGKKR
jgi:hypothetical protein